MLCSPGVHQSNGDRVWLRTAQIIYEADYLKATSLLWWFCGHGVIAVLWTVGCGGRREGCMNMSYKCVWSVCAFVFNRFFFSCLANMKLTSLILIALGACATATAENLWDNVTQTLEKYVYISKMAFSVGNGTGQQYTFGKGGVTLDTQQTMASSSKVLSWGSCFGLRASVYSHTTHNLVRAVPCGHVHPRCREWGAPRNWFKSFWGWLHFLLWPFCFVIPWCFFSTHLVSTFLSSIGTPTCISLRCGTGGQRMHPTSAPVWLWNLSFRSQAVRPLSHRTNHNFDTHTLSGHKH